MPPILEKILKMRKTKAYTSQAGIRDRIEEVLQERSGTPIGDDLASRVRVLGDRVLICQRASGPVQAGLPEGFNAKEAAKKMGTPWQDGYEDRIAPVWSSDERVNRYGDIDLQVWDFANYMNNPIVLLSHDWEGIPIGNSIFHEVQNRVDEGYEGPALRQVMLFAPQDANPIAETVNRLWKLRFLRTVSVAFYPGKVIDVEDPEERASLGLGKWGMVYSDLELIEVSPCSVPALPSAHNSVLNSAEARKILRASDFEVIREAARAEAISSPDSLKRWKALDANLRHIWTNLFPDTKIREHTNPEVPASLDATFGDTEEKKRFDEMEKMVRGLSTKVETLEASLASLQAQKARNETEKANQAFAILDRNVSAINSQLGVQKS